MFGFVIFGAKMSYETHARKTLMKLMERRLTNGKNYFREEIILKGTFN